jgi:hypothetical protein
MDTNIAAIQDALVAAIDAEEPGCRVSLGFPTGGTNEDMWLGVSAGVELGREMTGFCSRTESTELPVFMWVEKTGGTPKATRDRALAMLASLEDALASDRTLGGACDAARVVGFDMDDAYTEKTVQVGIRARLLVDSTTT